MKQLTQQELEDFTVLTFFLVHLYKAEPDCMWGGHKIGDVIEALARLYSIPVDVLRRLAE